MEAEDTEAVRRAQAGDRNALTTLLKRHSATMRQALAGKIPSCWQSVLTLDDVLQQTYVDVFLDIGRFDVAREGSFRGWLLTLAKRNLLDALRMLGTEKRGKEWHRLDPPSGDESLVGLYNLLVDTSGTPSRQMAVAEIRAGLERALELLPPLHRTVVQRCDLEGQSVRQVAHELGRTPGAVHMLRARAHRELADLLGTPARFLSGGN